MLFLPPKGALGIRLTVTLGDESVLCKYKNNKKLAGLLKVQSMVAELKGMQDMPAVKTY
jgi:hypothetical protein